MRKFLLSFALLVAGAMTVGAQTPAPVLELSQFGNYPYELSEADAEKVFALDDLTIAVKINTNSVSGRMALFATSDPTKEANSSAEGKDSRYVAYGMNGSDVGYLASWKSGDRFTGKSGNGITANTNDMVVVYIINPSNKTFKAYVNGVAEQEKVNVHNDGFMSGYEIATPKMVKDDHPNAKIYIGGGKHSGGDGEVFNGTICNVKVFSGALTTDQIASMCYPENAVTDHTMFVHGNVYTFQTKRGWLMAQENTDFVYSSGKLNDVTPTEDNANCQWVYYATEKGKYLYNVAVGRFVSYNSANLNSIPLSENPTTSAIEFKNSTLGGYPILLGVESKVVNHNLTNNSFTYGALLWGDGWTGYHNDEGSASLVLSQGAATAETLAAIKTKVDAFEADNTLAKEELNAAITAMEEWVTNNVAAGVGKYSYNGDDTFEGKIQTYKDYSAAIIEKNNPAPAEVEAKTAEVEALRNSFVINQPETGKFYRLKNHQSGWYATSDVRTGETQHATKLYMANENNTARTVWYLTADKKLLSYTKGQYLGDMSSDWSFEAIGAEGNVVTFNESAHEGKYQIIPSDGRALYGDQIRVDAAGSGNNSGNYAWTIEEVTWLPVEINPEVGYATLCSPVELGLNGRVTAYTGTLNGEWLTLTEQDVIPANTGVVLKYIKDAENGYVYLPVQARTTNVVENALVGTTEAVSTSGSIYTLQRHDFDDDGIKESIAFKQYTGASLKGFRAYLNASANAIGIRFEDGTTGIDHSELTIQNSELIFDLMGRRVETMTEGNIYIVNGKKVIR